MPEGTSSEDRDTKIVRAIDLFESLKPSDGIEAMLAVQMVGTYHAAVECLRRAMIPNQPFEGHNMALTQAQRLMSLYAKQLAALDKHRGKGMQKVVVEHVNVAAGGQAIVGSMESQPAMSGAAPTSVPQSALALEYQEPVPNPLDELAKTPAAKVKLARAGDG